jgi:hypothetical protein
MDVATPSVLTETKNAYVCQSRSISKSQKTPVLITMKACLLDSDDRVYVRRLDEHRRLAPAAMNSETLKDSAYRLARLKPRSYRELYLWPQSLHKSSKLS